MQKFFALIVIPLLFSLGACSSSSPARPDWVDGKPKQYPAQAYLRGNGQSEYRAIAQDRARADLSKIFQVKLSEQSEDSIEFKGTTLNGKQQQQLQSSSSRNITARTEQIVSGIEIAETWQDPQSKQYHALAILNRNKIANRLRQTINQQDVASEKEVVQAKQHSNLLLKISHASRALSLQLERQANQRILTIVDPTGMGVPPRYNPAALLADRDTLLRRLHIEAEITQDPIGGIEPIVTGALALAGFQHDSSGKARYHLVTALKLDHFRDDAGWYWYRGALQINLTDPQTQQDNGSHQWEIKVSAQRPESAMQRVRDTVNKTLSAELRDVIIQFGLPH